MTSKMNLNVKNMIQRYVEFGCEESTWKAFYEMAILGFITREEWDRFNNTCKGYSLTGDGVIDGQQDDKLVYKFDEQGFLRKIA